MQPKRKPVRPGAGLSPIVFALAFGAYAPAAQADQHRSHPAGHDQSGEDPSPRIHTAMSFEPSGNADLDFARGMIPHHLGAIDMAREVLERGGDPQIRRLARDVIAAQEAEIRLLETWLEANAPE